MRPRLAASAAVLTGVMAASISARADPASHPTARFDYTRGPGAESCPTEPELRSLVSERLGYDPFVDSAPRLVTAHIERRDARFRATASVTEADGMRRERAPIESRSNACRELASTLSLAISIAVDPMSLVREPGAPSAADPAGRPAEPPSHEAAVVAPPNPPPPSPPPAASSTHPLEGRVGLGAAGGLGFAPEPSFAAVVTAGIALRDLAAIYVEGRRDFGASASGPNGGKVTTSSVLVALLPCLERGLFAACLTGSIGTMAGEGSDVDHPTNDSSLYVAAGARGAFEVPLTGWLGVRAALEGLYALRPVTQRIAGATVWRTPAVAASFGAALMAHFP